MITSLNSDAFECGFGFITSDGFVAPNGVVTPRGWKIWDEMGWDGFLAWDGIFVGP